ncbi:hypothetical protein BC830DRAFT_1164364 [Chytriomyces sp. MP71]|nr:hypothetical protein BC830DRAFT_1164364 [Chytriomyces sp. MP71]
MTDDVDYHRLLHRKFSEAALIGPIFNVEHVRESQSGRVSFLVSISVPSELDAIPYSLASRPSQRLAIHVCSAVFLVIYGPQLDKLILERHAAKKKVELDGKVNSFQMKSGRELQTMPFEVLDHIASYVEYDSILNLCHAIPYFKYISSAMYMESFLRSTHGSFITETLWGLITLRGPYHDPVRKENMKLLLSILHRHEHFVCLDDDSLGKWAEYVDLVPARMNVRLDEYTFAMAHLDQPSVCLALGRAYIQHFHVDTDLYEDEVSATDLERIVSLIKGMHGQLASVSEFISLPVFESLLGSFKCVSVNAQCRAVDVMRPIHSGCTKAIEIGIYHYKYTTAEELTEYAKDILTRIPQHIQIVYLSEIEAVDQLFQGLDREMGLKMLQEVGWEIKCRNRGVPHSGGVLFLRL